MDVEIITRQAYAVLRYQAVAYGFIIQRPDPGNTPRLADAKERSNIIQRAVFEPINILTEEEHQVFNLAVTFRLCIRHADGIGGIYVYDAGRVTVELALFIGGHQHDAVARRDIVTCCTCLLYAVHESGDSESLTAVKLFHGLRYAIGIRQLGIFGMLFKEPQKSGYIHVSDCELQGTGLQALVARIVCACKV